LLLLLCLGLAGCSLGGDASYPLPRSRHQNTPVYRQSPTVFDARNADSSAPPQSSPTIGADNRLWRAALETVSFMPLVSVNASSGVIITDWYAAPNAPDQREKVNVYVVGRELRAESLRVSVFRQERSSDGAWTDTPTPSDTATRFENDILTRARRISALGSDEFPSPLGSDA
jgi:hypothetical protein